MVRAVHKTRVLAVASFAIAFFLSALTIAQSTISTRRIGVWWNGAVPHLSFSARDLADRNVRRKFQGGIRQTVVMRSYAYRERGGSNLAVALQSCQITYDLWQEVFRVQLANDQTDRTERVSGLDEVIRRCLTVRNQPLGDADNYQGLRGERIYVAVLVEFNPLSPDVVQRIRRWLARPAAGRVEGEAFFGPFVSLFVNRRIGAAERTVRFRSPSILVP